jgi:hypothetical protein
MERAATPFAVAPRLKLAIEDIVDVSQMWTVDIFPHSPVATIFLDSPPAMSRVVTSS